MFRVAAVAFHSVFWFYVGAFSYRTSMASLAVFALLAFVAHRTTFARDRVVD